MLKKIFITTFFLSTVSLTLAANRVALVIGNGDYQGGLSYLNNPTKDAALIKQTLEELGFRVISNTNNLNKEQLDKKLNEFARAARNAEIAFFYYAGHGSAHNGQNYLIPLKAGIESATQLPYRAVNSQEVLARMTANAKTSIMVLDACRDAPFTKSTTRGLAKITANRGSYIIYAADEGQVAYDNRVFAKALSRELLKPQSLQDVALSTRQVVLNATNDKQYPATYDKLRHKIYLNGKPNQIPQPLKPSQQVADIRPEPLQQPSKPNDDKRIAQYIVHNDGTVTDTKTGLMWQRCSYGQKWTGSSCSGADKQYQWDEARQLTDNFAGYSDWRLPKIDELESLVYCGLSKTIRVGKSGRSKGCAGDYRRPTINRTVFPDSARIYWSASPGSYGTIYAWGVYLGSGNSYYYNRSYSQHVRLVRFG